MNWVVIAGSVILYLLLSNVIKIAIIIWNILHIMWQVVRFGYDVRKVLSYNKRK